MRFENILSLVVIVIALRAMLLVPIVPVQQKHTLPTHSAFAVMPIGYNVLDQKSDLAFVDLRTIGLTAVPLRDIQLTILSHPVMPVLTHRPFT
jgi:hypothetical protein